MNDEKKKFDVYEYTCAGNTNLFSSGVKRDFGENKIVFIDDNQVFCSVLPLQDSNGLKKVGYLYA